MELFDTTVVASICTASDYRRLRAKIRFSRKLDRNSCHRPRRSRQTVYDENILDKILSDHDWQIKDDLTEDNELLVEGLKRCADLASLTQPSRGDRIPSTTRELLEKRRKLKLDLNATHLARLISNTSPRRLSQKSPHCHRQKKLLEAAPKRSCLKKRRRNLCDYSAPLLALTNEDGITKTSRRYMKLITKKIYTNLFCATIPVSDPAIPTGEKPEILPESR
ncbi:hypothetical protein KIN20_004069 [Parelaphostrongylus tenuis]|uniref:Uncharacterized protein n=1 Tax=Parelaphostrongylus tenuis TaxID=148309 RepID=A0AAD5LY92_PARTN|nr:hypothetical protein KIN20_004069 [Parelaphostrongylus tenuis]